MFCRAHVLRPSSSRNASRGSAFSPLWTFRLWRVSQHFLPAYGFQAIEVRGLRARILCSLPTAVTHFKAANTPPPLPVLPLFTARTVSPHSRDVQPELYSSFLQVSISLAAGQTSTHSHHNDWWWQESFQHKITICPAFQRMLDSERLWTTDVSWSVSVFQWLGSVLSSKPLSVKCSQPNKHMHLHLT